MGPTETHNGTCGNTNYYTEDTAYSSTSNYSDKEDIDDDIIDDDKAINDEIHKDNKHCFQRQAIKHVKRSRMKHKKPHMTRRII